MKPFLFISIFCVLTLASFSQSRKKADKNNLKSETIWEINDKGTKVKESFTSFDTKGNVSEEIKYDPTGTKVIEKKTYKYNDDNDITEERHYMGSDKVTKLIKYKYNEEEKVIQEDHYNGLGKLEKMITYSYNGKLKAKKNTFDAAGKLRKQKIYVYEKYPEEQ